MIRLLSASAPSPRAPFPAAAEAPSRPSNVAFIVAYGLALAGFAAGVAVTLRQSPTAFTPLDGFSALALFYIVAQAIERMIEPFTNLVTAKPTPDAPGKSKAEAASERSLALAQAYAAAPDATQAFVEAAARWQRVVDEIRANTALYAWGVATALGALASGFLGLYLMQAVGAKAVPNWLDVVVTGLIVGGGSKGLHDLISKIEKSKESSEDPPEAK